VITPLLLLLSLQSPSLDKAPTTSLRPSETTDVTSETTPPTATTATTTATTTTATTDPTEAAVPDSVVSARVTSLRLSLTAPRDGELERLEGYLRDVLGTPATLATVANVVKRIDRLQRYQSPLCRLERVNATDAVMACTLRRTRVIRQVIVETRDLVDLDGINAGLPVAILENDLKKRILLRTGEPLDDESAGRGRIARQRARIEDFLEREGFYGAQVKIEMVRVGDDEAQAEDNEVDVVIRVFGGSFVKVRRVNIVNFGPISQRRLIESFGNMCLNGEGLLDGAFVGNLTSCFNRRRLQATTERFTADLRALGYPEARLRVSVDFVDSRARGAGTEAGDDDECVLGFDEVRALSKEKLPLPPRCMVSRKTDSSSTNAV
jgi:hypothetical protein